MIAFIERLYVAMPVEILAVALVVAFFSLLARLAGLRRGVLASRPRALYGMIGTIGALMLFYALFALTEQPASIAARGGVVRILLSLHCIALFHWNWDYVGLALRRQRGG